MAASRTLLSATLPVNSSPSVSRPLMPGHLVPFGFFPASRRSVRAAIRALGFLQVVLEALPELRIGGRLDQLRQRFQDLIFGIVDIAQAVIEQVLERLDVFAEQSHSVSSGELGFVFGKRRKSWAVQRRSVGRELRAVAGTVPAALEAVPVDVAAEMGARCRTQEKLALLVAVGCHLAQAFAHDCTFARLQFIPGGPLARGDIFREVLCRCEVLGDERACRLQRLAAWIINRGPGTFALEDEIADEQTCHSAVRDALAESPVQT